MNVKNIYYHRKVCKKHHEVPKKKFQHISIEIEIFYSVYQY